MKVSEKIDDIIYSIDPDGWPYKDISGPDLFKIIRNNHCPDCNGDMLNDISKMDSSFNTIECFRCGHKFELISSGNVERVKNIISNKIKCKLCGDVIESTYTHDFKWCSCESVAVDGGKSYLRRCGEFKNYIEMSKEL